jgi:putative transposase
MRIAIVMLSIERERRNMIKAVKFQIIKPTNMTWEQFGNILFGVQRETRNLMNKAIQLCWEFEGFASDYKTAHGHCPDEKDILIGSKGQRYTLRGYIYDQLKNDTILYSGNCSQTLELARSRWNSMRKMIHTGEKSIPSYRENQPIALYNASIRFLRESGSKDYNAELKLLNRKGAKELGLNGAGVQVLLSAKDSSRRKILERIMSGEYKIGAGQITHHKNKSKWFLTVTYHFEAENKGLDPDRILGVDMGVVSPIYLAVSDSFERASIDGGEVDQFRKMVDARRISMLRQGKYCGDGRMGHGRKKRIAPTAKLRNKVANFRNTSNHKYARFVVEFAIKNGCGTIQMEDLSGIAAGEKKASFLGSWTYYDLQTKIENKAKAFGIQVVKIKPSHTSARCSECGFVHEHKLIEKWRPKQDTFKCMNCGYGHDFYVNADYNAARNIAVKGIDHIIKEQRKKQKSALQNGLRVAT